MRDILIATTNHGKVREFSQFFSAFPCVRLLSLWDYPQVEPAQENEDSYFGNARLKARYYYRCFGVPVLCDDSGLECEDLQGWPGVHSARIAASEKKDAWF